jgi:iron(III) transport system permease protein
VTTSRAATAVLWCGVVLLVAPMVWLVASVFATTTTTLTLPPAAWRAIATTVALSLLSASMSVLLGAPLSVMLQRTDVAGRRFASAVWIAPLVLPPYILAMACRALWAPRVGLMSRVLHVDVGIDSFFGIACVLAIAHAPWVMLQVNAALAAVDGSSEEAAVLCGASRLRAFVDVPLRLSLPALASSFGLCVVGTASSYGVPLLLGQKSSPPIDVVAVRVVQAWQSGNDAARTEAMLLSIALALFSFAVFAAPAAIARRRFTPSVTTTGKGTRAAPMALLSLRAPASALLWMLTAACVLLPFTALVMLGVTLRAGDAPSFDNVGVAPLLDAWRRSDVVSSLWTSLWTAALAAFFCAACAAALSTSVRSSSTSLRPPAVVRAWSFVAETVYATPGTIVAIAVLVTCAHGIEVVFLNRVSMSLLLAQTPWLLVFAYAWKHLALAVRSVVSQRQQIDDSLVDAALLAGASRARGFIDVILPLLRPALSSAAIAVFLASVLELTMSVLLQSPGGTGLGVVVFSMNDYGSPQQAAALASSVVVVVFSVQMLRRRA